MGSMPSTSHSRRISKSSQILAIVRTLTRGTLPFTSRLIVAIGTFRSYIACSSRFPISLWSNEGRGMWAAQSATKPYEGPRSTENNVNSHCRMQVHFARLLRNSRKTCALFAQLAQDAVARLAQLAHVICYEVETGRSTRGSTKNPPTSLYGGVIPVARLGKHSRRNPGEQGLLHMLFITPVEGTVSICSQSAVWA